MDNTGIYNYTTLIEIDVATGLPTGNVKPNLPSDPDYIAPITDLVACPLPTTTTTTLPNTTTTTSTSTSTTTTTTTYVEQLIITDVLQVIGASYNIFFTANFALTSLSSEISVDGVNWSDPELELGTTSPQSKAIPFEGSFYVRIYDTDSSDNIVYSNVFLYERAVIKNPVSMPSLQTLSFSKTKDELSLQGTASVQLDESLVYNGYLNSSNIPYSDVKIRSLPNRGTITVHGEDLQVNSIVPLSEIAYGGGQSTFEFWPTGSNGSQMPPESYQTSFEYTVFDTSGNQSESVTMLLNFTYNG